MPPFDTVILGTFARLILMKKQIKYLFITFCIIAGDLFCQQIPVYSQYYLNQFVYNPAMTGSENHSKIFLIHRSQWMSIPGMPVSNSATFDSPVKSKAGLGISLHNEKKGFHSKTGTYGYYSYKLKLSEYSKLMFGLSLGLVNDRADFSNAIVQNQGDPYLLNGAQQTTLFDSKAGIMLVIKKLELGFSALQLTANALQKSDYSTFSNMGRHFYFSSKYTITLSKEENISFYPFLQGKINPGNPFQYDISTVLDWKNKGWVAASYRSNYAIGLSGGVKLFKKLSIGYTYDIITNTLRSYGGLSHEIIIGYTFPDAKTRKYEKEIHEISKKLKKRGDSIIEELYKCFEEKERTNNKEEIEKIDIEIEKFKLELEKMKNIIEKKPDNDGL